MPNGAGITDSQIDEWYKQGIKAGAKGGKLLGAGNRGFLMFFAPVEKHRDIANAMGMLKKCHFFRYKWKSNCFLST